MTTTEVPARLALGEVVWLRRLLTGAAMRRTGLVLALIVVLLTCLFATRFSTMVETSASPPPAAMVRVH